jgi:hypothetical protein
MRNIYTSMALGSYGIVLKLAITRMSYGKARQKIKMQWAWGSVLWDDQSTQVGDSPDQLGFRYDVHKN